MPISFLDKNFGSTFFTLLDTSEKQIRLVCPFIGFRTASALADYLEESGEEVECTLITRFDREDFIKGVSSIAGLERLANAGARIYALQELHSKLYIFDRKSVIMGSANFTFNGFYKNHEFGVYMDSEPIFTGECNRYFDGLLNDIKKAGDWEVTIALIANEKKQCDRIVAERAFAQKKPGKNESPPTIFPNPHKWGAKLEFNNDSHTSTKGNNDFLEDILNEKLVEQQSQKRKTGIWLKFEGNSENRISNELTFLERRKKEHMKRTFFPKAPSGIKAGQILFMTMVSNDVSGNGTPIIVGYAETSGYNKSNIIQGSAPFNSKDQGRYPYYVELVKGRFLKGPIKYGISLRELARELNVDLYPNPKTNFNQLIYTHRQKSHIQITEKAHDYIIQRLESLFKTHGVDEI